MLLFQFLYTATQINVHMVERQQCVTFFVFRFFLRFSWRRILAVVLICEVVLSDSELVSIILDVSLQRKAHPHV